MRKYFIWLAAIAMLVTTASAAYAVDVKFTGFFRVRGVATENGDRNDRRHDTRQDNDRLFRPRFTYTHDNKKVWAIYEFDLQGGDWGADVARPAAGVNRYVVDFAIPGSTLRFRMGRTDWTSPDREIFDSFGFSRTTGFGIYGKLFGPVTLSAFTAKWREGSANGDGDARAAGQGGEMRDDADLYYVALAYKAAPSITITPWLGYDTNKATDALKATDPDIDAFYIGTNVKAKFGIASIDVTGVIQDGQLDYSQLATGRPDVDLGGYAVLIRTWFTFGKLKLGYAGTFISGDDDTTDATGTFGQQADRDMSRFIFPRNQASGHLLGPQLVNRRRYHAINIMGNNVANDSGGGGRATNGVGTHEFLWQYAATKDLSFAGEVGLIRSAASRADIDANFDGDTVDANDFTYDSDKGIGTEADFHFSYNIYKGLILKGTYSYLWAGDYGVEATAAGAPSNARDLDNTWGAHIGLRWVF